MRSGLYLSFVIAAWAGTACGGDPSGVDRVASDIVLVPSTVTMNQLETRQVAAHVVDQNGDKVFGANVAFATDTPGILSVSTSGLVTADGFAGTGSLTATFGTLTRTIPVTVHPVATRIAVFPGLNLTLPVNALTSLSVVVYDAADQAMGGPVSISSSAPSVAAVTDNGEVTTFGSIGNLTLIVQSGLLQSQITVQVVDFQRQSLPGEPFGVAVSVNDVAYVAALTGPMGRINLPNPTIASQIPITGTSVIFDASGTRAYVAGFWGSGLPVIDVAADSIIDSLGFFYATRFDVERSADGQKTFVGTNSGLVAITTSNGTTVDVPVGSYVNHLSRHPTLPLIYATQPDLGRVVEINASTNAIVRSFLVAGMVQATAVSANGNRLFIANESGEMGVWDLVAGTVLPSVKNVGNPFGLSLSPDGSKIYLSGSGVVRVLSATTLQVLTTFVTGGTPRAVAFNQAGTIAVSANQAGWVDFLP